MMGQEKEADKKQKKQFGRRKYLSNFVRNSEGTYVYVGEHIHWGEERKKELPVLWVPAAMQTVLALLCGCMPKAGMEQRFYVLIPYLLMFTGVFLQLWKLIDLTFAGKDIRDYIFKRTVPVLSVLPWAVIGACALTFAAEVIRSLEKDFSQFLWMGTFLACVAVIAGCAVFLQQRTKKMRLFQLK